MSNVITKNNNNKNVSRLITSFKKINEKLNTDVKGQFKHTVIIKTGDVTIKNSELDIEFTIPFDDDTEANEAEIIVYNLTNNTINNIKNKEKITVTAGYGKDTGVIFSGYISKKSTKYEDCDKVTTIKALDDMNLKEKDISSVSYAKGTKASRILKDLCRKVGLPIATFSVARDYTYKDEETVDGGLMDNIKRLAKICGVSAYILKSKIYVRPLNKGDNTSFILSDDTGLLDLSKFEEEETNADYKDTIRGYDIEMLLQHQIQTASIITINSREVKGKFRVKSGEHKYNGEDLITKAKVVYS
jgi:hypothetical protein